MKTLKKLVPVKKKVLVKTKLVKKATVKNTEGLDKIEYDKFPHIGSFHKLRSKEIKDCKFTVAGMITGCGIAQMHNVVRLCDNGNVTKEDLLNSLEDVKKDGVGAVICTLGASFYNREDNLLKLGFELLSEYPNYRHGSHGEYTQKCYILKL